MEIVLIGLSHRTATVELRERVAFSAEQAREAAGQLRSRGILEETLIAETSSVTCVNCVTVLSGDNGSSKLNFVAPVAIQESWHVRTSW